MGVAAGIVSSVFSTTVTVVVGFIFALYLLAGKEKICLFDVEKYPLLLREKGSTTRSLLEHFFFLHHIEASPVLESCNPQALIKAVQCGLGISFLPERWVREQADEGRLVLREMEEEEFQRENYVVWHENKFLSKTMKIFIEIIKQNIRPIHFNIPVLSLLFSQ